MDNHLKRVEKRRQSFFLKSPRKDCKTVSLRGFLLVAMSMARCLIQLYSVRIWRKMPREFEIFEILVILMFRPILQRTHCCVGPMPSLILPPFCLTWVAPRQLEEQDVSFYHPTVSLNLLANSGLSLLFWLGLVVLHDTLCGIHSECDGTQNNTDIGVLHRWKAMDKGQNFRKDSCTLIGEQ